MLDTIKVDAERACEKLAVAAYSLMDRGQYEATTALFTDDAVWVRGGKPVAGRDAILASLNQRPETDVSRHLVTNVMVSVSSDDEATGTATFIPLRGTRRITNVGDLAFRFRREADGWRIAHLQPTMIFKP
jgi:uncharacterized protein (TIGR02246 family)